MQELKLEAWRKGRLWLDEPLPATFTPQEIREEGVKAASAAANIESHYVAIELRLLRGSRPVYGLLGASFDPEPSSTELVIKALIGEGEISYDQEFIAIAPEIIQIGLTEEYTLPILERSVETLTNLSPLASGVLTFNCAVHGTFTSNTAIFGFLSQLVTTTTSLLCKQIDLETVMRLVTSAINSF
ncbi:MULTISPECIES: hypothetical protein [unclassified Nodularia (in: cyanobacteria)]|uniref:hypothetical protein n=1 Tax=unclassified Nodularia (in: cyanobacteria) TaxID=2656917 RepID=UPI001880D1C8|nr:MULTISPECIES: hypothetical protein [unclassified Nodularia (in: cyanobacteria)]MBE9198742.1 hypothetical protein [Nodularia sp. LEGE 06071]MCC2693970.1 hypothetical protein [Nodularia sp. LEGE 04288]